jgi:hypothetical protein
MATNRFTVRPCKGLGDKSFYRAALQGTKQHHWNFGDMAPVEGMTRKKMDSLVPYIRYYQQQKKLY